MTRRTHFTRARPERKRHEDRLRQLNACACDCTHVCVRVGASGDHRMGETDKQTDGRKERERENSSKGSFTTEILNYNAAGSLV